MSSSGYFASIYLSHCEHVMILAEMGSSQVRRITLLILMVVTLYAIYLLVSPFAGPLLMGGLLALIFLPVHQRIERRVSGPTLASLVSTVLMLLVILTPLTFLVIVVSEELRQAYDAVRTATANGGTDRMLQELDRPLSTIAAWIGMTGPELGELINARVVQGGAAVLREALVVIGSVPSGAIKFIVMLLAFFFALRDGNYLYSQTLRWFPLGPVRTAELLRTSYNAIVASVNGIVAVSLAQGVLCGIGIWIAGLPSPALWGVAAGVVSVIPIVGTALVWIPAAAVLFAQGSWKLGVFMLVWGALPVAQADNIVRPLVLTAQLPVNALVLFVAMLGGASAFGLPGIFLGPVLVAVSITLFRFVAEEFGAGNE
jgi:predicted PurR-regulated permease PerM